MSTLSQIASTPSHGYATVSLRGDFDVHTASRVWRYLSYLIVQGHHHIVLDLGATDVVDPAGMEVVARAAAWIHRSGGDFVLRAAGPAVVTSFETTEVA
jgi:anti-sigma B factor antagonist